MMVMRRGWLLMTEHAGVIKRIALIPRWGSMRRRRRTILTVKAITGITQVPISVTHVMIRIAIQIVTMNHQVARISVPISVPVAFTFPVSWVRKSTRSLTASPTNVSISSSDLYFAIILLKIHNQ